MTVQRRIEIKLTWPGEKGISDRLPKTKEEKGLERPGRGSAGAPPRSRLGAGTAGAPGSQGFLQDSSSPLPPLADELGSRPTQRAASNAWEGVLHSGGVIPHRESLGPLWSWAALPASPSVGLSCQGLISEDRGCRADTLAHTDNDCHGN